MLKKFQEALNKRKEAGVLRTLKPKLSGIDFYSNDYLGLAGNEELQSQLLMKVQANPVLLSGSSGSRLISGNSNITDETENYIAEQHQYSAALLFSSGYNANLALFSTLPDRHDTIIVDEQIHRSVHDACKMSHAKKIKFRHNDLEDLESILKKQNGSSYIAIESLYSMDGDFAPLQEIATLAKKYNSALIVDEAHAFGVFGYGLIEKHQLQNDVFAALMTYGKALGAHGAAVLCNETVKCYLVNFASPFIYTTAAQDFLWISIKNGYEFLKLKPELSKKLHQNIKIFRDQNIETISSEVSPIQAIMVPDNHQLRNLQITLSCNGFLTYAVHSPTVKTGAERLRICLHSFNTEEDIAGLTGIIKEFI
ncbi:aminotransferase class I/II-fold pyridoxal phosphate-dependent enzyme [Chryseobacterium lathyri]|jgi:8-amino-7-oxononanoate synthase|uniref:8-amino-7-oxononanoate synthase n=1 Tax=Chryseobacterium lathyri TaxID=395933 RepID=A0ABT9SJW1_9FLAO|nr:aminotransferase class I/II-fold pyridoxal phosphate-dependent enzyme [Chryseobacterium lathyri]MDP9959716.1 8-amino-7-oxononanoate synthase [Chryseobacterium lathyri]MDQ0064711.1 8-amino-7-oxononanoate synthase [Chryseobacterium lathyri]